MTNFFSIENTYSQKVAFKFPQTSNFKQTYHLFVSILNQGLNRVCIQMLVCLRAILKKRLRQSFFILGGLGMCTCCTGRIFKNRGMYFYWCQFCAYCSTLLFGLYNANCINIISRSSISQTFGRSEKF